MAITDLATVKLVSDYADRYGQGVPDASTTGDLGDIYLDTDSGLTYELTSTGPNVWTAYTQDDARITLFISRAEQDYLTIRNTAFKVDPYTEETVYPDGSGTVAAEMVCYLMGIGGYKGRGKSSESLADRSRSYEAKIGGYPASITGQIQRYQKVI